MNETNTFSQDNCEATEEVNESITSRSWIKDVEKGHVRTSSEAILIEWMLKPGNWRKYTGADNAGIKKSAMLQEIVNELVQKGKDKRSQKQVRKKIESIHNAWKKTFDELRSSGQGNINSMHLEGDAPASTGGVKKYRHFEILRPIFIDTATASIPNMRTATGLTPPVSDVDLDDLQMDPQDRLMSQLQWEDHITLSDLLNAPLVTHQPCMPSVITDEGSMFIPIFQQQNVAPSPLTQVSADTPVSTPLPSTSRATGRLPSARKRGNRIIQDLDLKCTDALMQRLELEKDRFDLEKQSLKYQAKYWKEKYCRLKRIRSSPILDSSTGSTDYESFNEEDEI